MRTRVDAETCQEGVATLRGNLKVLPLVLSLAQEEAIRRRVVAFPPASLIFLVTIGVTSNVWAVQKLDLALVLSPWMVVGGAPPSSPKIDLVPRGCRGRC